MPATSKVSVQVGLGLNSTEYKRQVAEAIGTNQDFTSSFDTFSTVIPEASRDISHFADSYSRTESILDNAGLRINDLTRQLSGLFQAQRRTAASRRDLADEFSKTIDSDIQQRVQGPDQRSSRAIETAMTSQRQLLRSLQSEHRQVAVQMDREARLVEQQSSLQKELNRLKREEPRLIGDDAVRANAAAQADIRKQIEASGASASRLAATEQRSLDIRQRAKTVEGDLLSLASDLSRAREKEADAAEKNRQAQIKAAAAQREAVQAARDRATQLASTATGQDRAFRDATTGPDLRSAAELRAAQAEINRQIQQRREFIQQAADKEMRAAKAGQDTARHQETIAKAAKDIERLQRDRVTLSGRIKSATRDERESLASVHGLMAQLGSRESRRQVVTAQITTNAREFERSLQMAIKAQKITVSEAAALRTEFEKINTSKNVGRQVAGVNRLGQSMNQVAFIVDDFSNSSGQLSDRLRGVSNNLQMLMMGLGPYGALAGVAIGVTAQLAAKWWESRSAADDTADAVEKLARTYNDLAATQQRAHDAAVRIRDLERGENLEAMKGERERLEDELARQQIETAQATAKREEEVLRKRGETLQREIGRLTKIEKERATELRNEFSKINLGAGDQAEANRLGSELMKIEERLKSLRAEQATATKRLIAMDDHRTDAQRELAEQQDREAKIKEQIAAADKRMAALTQRDLAEQTKKQSELDRQLKEANAPTGLLDARKKIEEQITQEVATQK